MGDFLADGKMALLAAEGALFRAAERYNDHLNRLNPDSSEVADLLTAAKAMSLTDAVARFEKAGADSVNEKIPENDRPSNAEVSYLLAAKLYTRTRDLQKAAEAEAKVENTAER
jgi:hypothetical protein